MTFKSVALEICRREGLIKQVNVAQVSEVLRVLREMCQENPEVAAFMNKAKKTVKKESKRDRKS